MSFLFETLSSCAESTNKMSYSEIYVRGMPVALVYAALHLTSARIIQCQTTPMLLFMSAVQWPLLLPVYIYAVYKYKIKNKLL